MVIKYITNVRLPTPRAQGYAIMKMCSEFANLGTVVELFVPSRQNTEIEKDPFDFYSIEKNFEIKRIRSSDFLGSNTKLSRLLYWVDIIVFFLCARFKIKFNRGDILFTRDPVALLFFSKKIFSCLHIISIPESRTILKYILYKGTLPRRARVLARWRVVRGRLGPRRRFVGRRPSGVLPRNWRFVL